MNLATKKLAQWSRRSSHKVMMGCSVLFAAAAFQSCEKDILTGQPSWLGNSIYERLEEGIVVNDTLREFTIVKRLIDDLNLKEVLSKTGSKTLFVASDDAYARWFKNNSWGVTSYEQLTLAQKKMLLNNSMINNAYLLELMSNVSGNPPKAGYCMRRATASSIFDSIPTMSVAEMPVDPMLKERLDTWASLRKKGEDIHILMNNDEAPMIHFLPAFMSANKITDKDLYYLTNGKSNSINDSWINGQKVISSEQTCKNGYIYVVDGVIESNKNMAEIIRTQPEMSRWSHMLDRFATPVKATGTLLSEYQRLNNTTDSVYVLRYFSKESLNQSKLETVPSGFYVPAMLAYDPGLNQYMWDNKMNYDMHYDAGAMIVPTNEAVKDWWENSGVGKSLREEYHTIDSVPAKTLSKLLNVNMLTSFVDAVPSKFNTIVDDAKIELGITEDDIVKCYMGCNGVVYLVKRVFGPSEYRSVVYPALAHQSILGVIYYAIDTYGFGPFLNSMDSRFSMFLPLNTTKSFSGEHEVFNYIDPCTYGQSMQTLWQFYMDEETQTVKAERYHIEMQPDGSYSVVERFTSPTDAAIQNRLEDLVDNMIVVGDIEDGNEYYKTKAGSVLRIEGTGKDMAVQGGFQMETGQKLQFVDVYDMSQSGNGKSYSLAGTDVPLTSSKSVCDVLAEHVAAEGDSLFYKLLRLDPTKADKSLLTDGNNTKNIRIFESYNYTVYVPTDKAVQKMIDDGFLPTWDAYYAYNEKVDEGDADAIKCQDSIAEVIHNFVRYHIQDNSVYMGMGNIDNKFESAKLNKKINRFYSLTVSANKDDLSVTDQLGNTYHVVKSQGLYNKTCREYNISGSGDGGTIKSSSNAVVHMIDGCLIFDRDTQLVPWTSHLPVTK